MFPIISHHMKFKYLLHKIVPISVNKLVIVTMLSKLTPSINGLLFTVSNIHRVFDHEVIHKETITNV